MPEAFTYYDRQRTIAAQVPAVTYTLEVHEQWFRANTSTIPTIWDGELLEKYPFESEFLQFFFKY